MIDEAALQTAFNAVIAGRGDLSSFHADIARMIAQLMLSSKTVADAGQLSALASDVARLEALLPPIGADSADDFDIRRLSDSELRTLEAIQNKACNIDAPSWTPDDDAVAPEITPRERGAINLARWVDARASSWNFGGPTEVEMIHMRNEITSIVSPTIAHALYRGIIGDELRDKYEREISRALAASGSDVRVVPLTAEERRQIEPPALLDDPSEPPRTNGAGDLTAVWPFSPDKPPQ